MMGALLFELTNIWSRLRSQKDRGLSGVCRTGAPMCSVTPLGVLAPGSNGGCVLPAYEHGTMHFCVPSPALEGDEGD